jgi:AcrR family transcriptional regulator
MYNLFEDLSAITLALLLRTFERLFSHMTTRVKSTHTAKAAVLALVGSHLEWILAHPEEGRFMYQAMSMELGAKVREPLQQRKAELLIPLGAHLVPFIEEGSLPDWSPVMLDIVLLGVSHEACRRYLGGAALEPAWMRAHLPQMAWKSIVLM